MGRFAYQPLTEEQVKISQSGQLIIGKQDGHLSVNKNGIIISKTKEIEDKIDDINELKYDAEEQEDVILNLLEDYNSFIKDKFEEANEKQEETYIFDKRLLAKINYMDSTQTAMDLKQDRIQEMINDLINANNLQLARLNVMESEATDTLSSIGDMAYVQNEYNTITALRMTYA